MSKVRFIIWNILEVPAHLEGEEEGELGFFFFLITSQIIPPPFSLSNHVNDQGNENKALDSQLTLSSCYIRSRRSSLTGRGGEGGRISAGETNLQAGILSPTPIN